jgi:SAM-dependent methyltransferase
MSYYTLKNNVDTLQQLKSKYDPQNNGLKLDLGCGYYKPVGFIGVDNLVGHFSQIENQGNFPDILMDLNNEKIPFEDNTCIEIRASHFIEHSHLDHIFQEVWRLLKPHGTFQFIVPYANSAEGMYPGHSIFLTEKFFYENLHFQNLFKITKEIYKESTEYKGLPKSVKKVFPFEIARKHLFNACHEMEIFATPKK